MAFDDSRPVAELDLAPNEASGLPRVRDREMLATAGWDRAFWSVLDEVDVVTCVAVIGHVVGAPLERGWQARKVTLDRDGDGGRADDAEALASHEGWVYLFGSQHGGKDGPIRRREQLVWSRGPGDARGVPARVHRGQRRRARGR